MRRFHHIGIPTQEPIANERHLVHLKMFVSDYKQSPYGIEWMRFEVDAPYPELEEKKSSSPPPAHHR